MRRIFIATTALAFTMALALSLSTRAQDNTATVSQPKFPPGFQAKKISGVDKEIKRDLATMTEAALKPGKFDDMVERLTSIDRERIQANGFTKNKFEKLDGRIAQIRNTWKSKYGEDFNMDGSETIFDERYPLVTGEVSDPNTAVNNWPVRKVLKPTGAAAAANESREMKEQNEENASVASARQDKPESKKLESGRNVALFEIPPSAGEPGLIASFLHEMPSYWRLDIPDNITGQQIHDQLLDHLTWLGEHADQWPADKTDAKRMFAHHVVLAVENVPLTARGSSGIDANR
jgi:hypothetical protein